MKKSRSTTTTVFPLQTLVRVLHMYERDVNSTGMFCLEDIGNRVARWAKDLPGPNGFISHTRPPSPARTRSVKKEWSSNKRIDNHLPGSPSGFVSHTRPPPPSESEHSQQVQRLINTTGTGGAHHTRLPKKERRSNKQKPCEQRLHQNNANRGEKRRREVNLKDREHHVDSIAKVRGRTLPRLTFRS